MDTTETDLIEGDPALLDLIHTFTESSASDVSEKKMLPFSLTGFPEFALSARYELQPGELLVWVVRAKKKTGRRAHAVELRYGIEAPFLGDVDAERARCEWRLRKLAEAHLRAHLHMLKFELGVPSTGRVTLLDARGRLRDS